jgi:pyrimidine deaminase RibD-like protein
MNVTKLVSLARNKARHKAHRHATMITRGGAVVAFGTNHDETHAEVAALNNLWPDQRPGTRAISIRLRRSGTLGMAKPCPECQEYMRKNGVKSVMYTNREGGWEHLKL